MTSEIAYTAEFQRVASLPRRVWNGADLASLSSSLTEILRSPACRSTRANPKTGLCSSCGAPFALRPVQALALHDAGIERGLFGSIGVGEGKSLLTMLLAVVIGARRPLLLLPGGLVEKARRDRLELARHWRIPNELRVFSYDLLGRVAAVDELDNYQPDAIICDEVHRLKNKRAAVTRRVARYMHDRPETIFCGVSGTVMDKSLKDFAHILLWALKWRAPVPTSPEEIEEWAATLDTGVDAIMRPHAGALLTLCTPDEKRNADHVAARLGFRRRLTETPGVVATIGEGEHVDCSIYVRAIRHPVSPATERNFLHLRGNGTDEHPGWQTPDDWDLDTAVDVWRHAQELALGLHYAWDPRPPIEWREARKDYHRFVRETISRSRTYDSELHVRQAIDAGSLPLGVEPLRRWRELEPTFTPNVVPVWHDDSALEACRDWMARGPGIVWTEHGFFAERLAAHTGATYYGAGGFAPDGRYIEDASPKAACIASIDANREGKNLQHIFSRCLFVCPPPSPTWLEQAIARIHRPGQTADEVTIDVLLGCRENFDAIMRAIEGARAVQDVTGKRQKILLADVVLPTEAEIDALRSPRWCR